VRLREAISSSLRSRYERQNDEHTYGNHCEESQAALPTPAPGPYGTGRKEQDGHPIDQKKHTVALRISLLPAQRLTAKLPGLPLPSLAGTVVWRP
jgi:hypothetical protein